MAVQVPVSISQLVRDFLAKDAGLAHQADIEHWYERGLDSTLTQIAAACKDICQSLLKTMAKESEEEWIAKVDMYDPLDDSRLMEIERLKDKFNEKTFQNFEKFKKVLHIANDMKAFLRGDLLPALKALRAGSVTSRELYVINDALEGMEGIKYEDAVRLLRSENQQHLLPQDLQGMAQESRQFLETLRTAIAEKLGVDVGALKNPPALGY